MTITYRVYIDRNDDAFDQPSEEITTDVVALTWRLGMARAYDTVCEPGTARITVNNRSGAYSPERDDLQTGWFVRIRSDDGTQERVHFCGFLRRIEPSAGDQGDQMAVLVVDDVAHQLRRNHVRVAPLLNARADEALHALLDSVRLRLHPLAARCIINLSGRNVINTVFIIGSPNVIRDFEAGKSTFAYVGDGWPDDMTALEAIRQVVAAERGRFFINRDGQAAFINRHHMVMRPLIDAAFSDDMAGLRYAYGGDTANEVTITATPRSVGPPDDLLWTLNGTQRIEAHSTQTIRAAFNADDERRGALTIIPPLPGVHYSATLHADGSGGDRTGALMVGVTAGGTGADVEIRNITAADVHLQTLTLRGTAITSAPPVAIILTDKARIAFDGLSPLMVDSPLLSSVEEARRIARYELERRRHPRGRVRALTLDAINHTAAVVGLTLFDRITVSEAQTGHSGGYFIVAEEHTVERGGTRHRVTWTLEPADDDIYFVVNGASINGARLILPF